MILCNNWLEIVNVKSMPGWDHGKLELPWCSCARVIVLGDQYLCSREKQDIVVDLCMFQPFLSHCGARAPFQHLSSGKVDDQLGLGPCNTCIWEPDVVIAIRRG